MSWIHAFELMCYAIVAITLTDLIRKKIFQQSIHLRLCRTG